MTDNDVIAWIVVIAAIGLVCVGVGVWQQWKKYKHHKEIMRDFWKR